jgi:hypothetical protein
VGNALTCVGESVIESTVFDVNFASSDSREGVGAFKMCARMFGRVLLVLIAQFAGGSLVLWARKVLRGVA